MDQLEVAGALGLVGTAVTALAFAVKQLSKRREAQSMRPPVSVPKASVSGQMRAMSEAMLRAEQEQVLRVQVHQIHDIVTARDSDGFPRVHNKASVEAAILESRDLDREQTKILQDQSEILSAILDELRARPQVPKPQTTYRQKLPSNRGGE